MYLYINCDQILKSIIKGKHNNNNNNYDITASIFNCSYLVRKMVYDFRGPLVCIIWKLKYLISNGRICNNSIGSSEWIASSEVSVVDYTFQAHW